MAEFSSDLTKVLKGDAILDSKHLQGPEGDDIFERIEPAIGKAWIVLDKTRSKKIRARPVAKPALGKTRHSLNVFL